MKDWIDRLFGESSRPVQRDAKIDVMPDPDGTSREESSEATVLHLSPDGSLDSVTRRFHRAYSCGCPTEHPVGGHCSVCKRLSCERHAGHCGMCRRPLCLEHSNFLVDLNSQEWRLCRRCHGEATRRLTARRLLAWLTS